MTNETLTIVSTIFAGGTVSCIGFIFQRAFTLGTRVTVIETKQEDLPVLINSKFDDLGRRLDRIERAMNGTLKGH